MTQLFFRVATSSIFVVAGLGHVLNHEHVVQRLETAPLGYLATSVAPADLLVLLAGVAMAVGGVALAVGWRTRSAALGLIAILVPITITVQLGSLATIGPLFKNIAILGALVHFADAGAGERSIDRWLGGDR